MAGQDFEDAMPDAVPPPQMKRLSTVVYGPYSAGQLRQRAPD